MKKRFPILMLMFFVLGQITVAAQTNSVFSSVAAEQVIKGTYNPSNYLSASPISEVNQIVTYLNNGINADSLKSYILELSEFQNRNTASDTLSVTSGIGAARNWGLNKFNQFSFSSQNRLIPAYFQFDKDICGITRHKNVLAVLPGTDTSDHEVVLIEGHLDSRCQGECDIACLAEGIEDNASGTALVIEMARVLSKCTFRNTLVFMLTIGEEQGLHGADAFADYCNANDIPLKAVLNNDVIGGVICGQTSSPPSCPGLNDVDSTQVRIFSYGGFNSIHKQLARFIKLEYQELLQPLVSVPMTVTIMSGEDRSGRGGDHIPFRVNGFASCRFTSANEHGDASIAPSYTDRQHTSSDILGIDTDLDGAIDSFFVDFNYLARNARINGVGVAVAANGPKKPDFSYETIAGPGIIIHVTQQAQYATFRVGVRTTNNDWDSVYTINGANDTIFPPQTAVYYVSIASVDNLGHESLFSKEVAIQNSQISLQELEHEESNKSIELLQNRPNPFDETTIIGVWVKKPMEGKAKVVVMDINGKITEQLPIELDMGINELFYHHGFGKTGTYVYALFVNGQEIDRKTMVFAN